MDHSKSIAYVEENGTKLEIARMKNILYDIQPEPEDTSSFIELQNPDGGIPYDRKKGNLSAIGDTLTMLWWLDDLGMLESPFAVNASRYIIETQLKDGSWDEDPLINQYNPPPWARSGDLRTILYLSSYCAYWLATMNFKTNPAYHRALTFLMNHQDKTGKFFGYAHTTWIATSVFLMAGRSYLKIAQKGLHALSDRSLSDWADSNISWALVCLGKAGLDNSHPLVKKLLVELIHRQNPHGNWSSEDGEAFSVSATIEALKALTHFGY